MRSTELTIGTLGKSFLNAGNPSWTDICGAEGYLLLRGNSREMWTVCF